MEIPSKIILSFILLVSLWLNTTGLIPNTFFHQNEPGLLGPSDQLFKNIVNKLDFDPNIKPDAFKYGSVLFYTQAFIRGGTLFFIYRTNKITHLNFGKPASAFDVSYKDFVSDNGPHYFENQMLWASRFFTAILGVGCVYLTYIIALNLFSNKIISLLSAAALAVMPLHVRNSHYALADIPQVFFFLLSFWASFKMYQQKTIKSYLLAGFLVGFSTSLKYFPLSLLPFLIFHFLTERKNFLSKNVFSAFLSMFFGYLMGMPYLFIHFNEIIGFIPYALNWYAPDKLSTQNSIIEKLLPNNVHAYHLKFLFGDAMLPVPFIASLSGLVIGLKYFRKPTLFSLIIPLANGIFIFFYVHQIYEQLPLPMLSFMAIFIGITAYYLINLIQSKKIFLLALVLLTIYLPSFLSSAQASLACSTPITEYQARDWIRSNIPLKSNFAFEEGSRLPSEMDINWIKSEIPEFFTLSELQDVNAKYLMTMNGYYGVRLSWSYDVLIPPKNIVDNQFVGLVINEYNNSAIHLKSFVKPYMCMSNEIYIYKIPTKLTPSTKLIKQFTFDNAAAFNNFALDNILEETTLSGNKDKGHLSSGALNYSYIWGKFNNWRIGYPFLYATAGRSQFLDAQENKKYTLEGWVFPQKEFKKKEKDFFLRIDFYENKNKPPIKTSLSSRTTNQNSWQKISLTILAPKNTKFIKVGFQSLAKEASGSYLIDDMNLYEN